MISAERAHNTYAMTLKLAAARLFCQYLPDACAALGRLDLLAAVNKISARGEYDLSDVETLGKYRIDEDDSEKYGHVIQTMLRDSIVVLTAHGNLRAIGKYVYLRNAYNQALINIVRLAILPPFARAFMAAPSGASIDELVRHVDKAEPECKEIKVSERAKQASDFTTNTLRFREEELEEDVRQEAERIRTGENSPPEPPSLADIARTISKILGGGLKIPAPERYSSVDDEGDEEESEEDPS